ncbi:MAG: signal peptidase II [Synergistaceae bacterium]|jgi:signal peptidase II|nr:signal peptidase II [Synergistaceae bacterium]
MNLKIFGPIGPIARSVRPLVFALFLLLDRAAKFWAMSSLARQPDGARRAFLSLGLYFNRGISFSLLGGHDRLVLLASLAGLAVISLACARSEKIRTMRGIPLLYAGAVGNLSDRLAYGYVIDWIYVGLHINLADVWLCAGCALIAAELAKSPERA